MAIPTIKMDIGIAPPTKLYSDSKKPVIPCSKASRGILKRNKGKETIHFNGDSLNTELLFRTIHSVNQLSTYGAVANWE